ncbi:MAG TPA: hypothetical protein VG897_06800 [Terriglobales bacterium]|nr:hypothetical protein [Terriglobales bacterium]
MSEEFKIPYDDADIAEWYACERCQQPAPRLKKVSRENIEKWARNSPTGALERLRQECGVRYETSKLAVHYALFCKHPVKATCPHCGKTLRTDVAKQCRFCLADWH